MTRLGKNSIRIEYDRTGQNAEIMPYWARLEDRPYYELEKRYTDGLGEVRVYQKMLMCL